MGYSGALDYVHTQHILALACNLLHLNYIELYSNNF